jgi:predicted enzyme related to lactoylglutathione lyase
VRRIHASNRNQREPSGCRHRRDPRPIGWVARYSTPGGDASVQLVTSDATAPHDSVISVHVGDSIDDAYEEAKRRGYEIVHPLTDEPSGVRRFLVRAPDGNVINLVSHGDE